MSWNIEYLESESTILITTSGAQDMAAVQQMATEVAELAARFGVTRFLKDDREATLQLSTMEIFDVPKILTELGIPNSSRIAVVIKGSTAQARDFRFFETRSHNEGRHYVRIFTDSKEQALQWVTAKSPSEIRH